MNHQVPVDAGRKFIVQRHLDHLRLNRDLARRPILHGVEIHRHLVETVGVVADLQQGGLAIEIEFAVGRQQRLHPGGQIGEQIARVGSRHLSGAAAVHVRAVLIGGAGDARTGRRRNRRRGGERSRARPASDDVVQVVDARFNAPLEDTDQIPLHRVVHQPEPEAICARMKRA